MGQRDQFVRQTNDLARLAVTRPLPRQEAKDDPRELLASALSRGRDWLTALEPNVELLHQACLRAKLPLPGVPHPSFKHPLSPRGEEALGYMFQAFKANPLLRQRVQIAVFRFYEARAAAVEAQVMLDGPARLDPEAVELLRRKLYHLFNFHAAFAGEPLLSKLFPGPKTTAPAVAPALTNLQKLKQKLAREAAIERAEALIAEVTPVLRQVQLVLEAVDHPKIPGLGELLVPATRQARLLAIGLAHAHEEEAIATLRQAVAALPGARQALERVRKGAELELLEPACAPLSSFCYFCRQHAMLAFLFPAEPSTEALKRQQG